MNHIGLGVSWINLLIIQERSLDLHSWQILLFLSTYYNIQEQIEDFNASEPEEVEEFVQDIISQLEELRDQCQDSLDNMPESLQESDTGQLLQERIDECESLISDFWEYRHRILWRWYRWGKTEEGEDTEDDAKEEWLENVIAEIQDVSFNL